MRALTEAMQVVEQAPGLYSVFSGSGNEYTVNVDGKPACTCPDFERRDDVAACKHIRRVRLETGKVAIPAQFDQTAMDDLLVRGIRAGRVRVRPTVATDGGAEGSK